MLGPCVVLRCITFKPSFVAVNEIRRLEYQYGFIMTRK